MGYLLACVSGWKDDEPLMPAKELDTIDVEDWGDNTRLICPVTATKWYLTDETVLLLDSNNPNPRIVENGKHLVIANVQYQHSGRYYCVLDDGSSRQNYTMVLQRRPRTGWEIYRMNAIVGLSTTAIFIVLLAIVLFLYLCRWQDPNDKLDNTYANVKKPTNGTVTDYDNPTFQLRRPMSIHEETAATKV